VSRAEDSDSPSNRPLAPRKAKSLWTLHHKKGMTIYDLCAEFKVSPGFVRFKVRSDNGGNRHEEDSSEHSPYRPGRLEATGTHTLSKHQLQNGIRRDRQSLRPSSRGRDQNHTSRER